MLRKDYSINKIQVLLKGMLYILCSRALSPPFLFCFLFQTPDHQLLEDYFSSWVKCMFAHVTNLQGLSVISVPSLHFQAQALPRSLGLSCSRQLPVSQARWSPLHTLPSDTTLKVRTSQVTFISRGVSLADLAESTQCGKTKCI